jgi:hypothetical protein
MGCQAGFHHTSRGDKAKETTPQIARAFHGIIQSGSQPKFFSMPSGRSRRSPETSRDYLPEPVPLPFLITVLMQAVIS